jgi:hypothetical protein
MIKRGRSISPQADTALITMNCELGASNCELPLNLPPPPAPER